MNTAIEYEDVSLDRGQTRVLHDVSLRIEQYAFVSVVGTSGAGKSTLLKCINRLVEPASGTVMLHGADTKHIPVEQLRRSIGYVFQGVGLFPHMSAAENIGVALHLRGEQKRAIEDRVLHLIDVMELSRDTAARMPHQLSGGQRQRIGIARALAAEPKIMLLDEPFGSLDPVTRDNLCVKYSDLHQRLKLTTMMVTHDITEALLLSDLVVVMDAGRVKVMAPPAELLLSDDEDIKALVHVARRNADRIAAMGREKPHA